MSGVYYPFNREQSRAQGTSSEGKGKMTEAEALNIATSLNEVVDLSVGCIFALSKSIWFFTRTRRIQTS